MADDPCTVAIMLRQFHNGQVSLDLLKGMVEQAFAESGTDYVKRQSAISQLCVALQSQPVFSSSFADAMQFSVQKGQAKHPETSLSRVKAEEGFMVCSCGSKRINWEDRQTRSADEGSTLFCKCTECGKFWKIQA